MKKKIIVSVIIIVLLILLIPIRFKLRDGGTVEWTALTYKISKVHRLNEKSKTGYEDGLIIEILGIKIYDNVIVENSNIDKNDKVENVNVNEVTWEEITADGVNEELLFKNVDTELLTQIASEIQALIEEEVADERANPEIVITEGWIRIFKKKRYENILNIGKPAMKPLYLILYKSSNAGLYEYICAEALYELSESDFKWATSREFLEKFNEKILAENN